MSYSYFLRVRIRSGAKLVVWIRAGARLNSEHSRTFPTGAALTCGYYPKKIAWAAYDDLQRRIIQRSQRTLRASKREPSLPNSNKSLFYERFFLPPSRSLARAGAADRHFVDCSRVVFHGARSSRLTFNARKPAELDAALSYSKLARPRRPWRSWNGNLFSSNRIISLLQRGESNHSVYDVTQRRSSFLSQWSVFVDLLPLSLCPRDRNFASLFRCQSATMHLFFLLFLFFMMRLKTKRYEFFARERFEFNKREEENRTTLALTNL